MSKPLTTLELISDRAIVASNAARARRDLQTGTERNKTDMKSYREGEAAAYNDARKLMEAELRRLCNKMQNGCLRIDDFGITL